MNDVGWVVLNSIPNILTTVIIFTATSATVQQNAYGTIPQIKY